MAARFGQQKESIMTAFDIYGIGNALVDTEIEISDEDLARFQIEKGVMTLVDESRQHELMNHLGDHLVYSKRASGGSAANTVIAASYFGATTFYSCKVSNDDNGQFYQKDLVAAGVKFSNQQGHEGITGKCLVMITPDAERTMNTYLGISESVSAEQLDTKALAASRYAYVEGYLVSSPSARAAAIEMRAQAEATGVKTAISLSDPAMVAFFKDGLKEMIGSGVDLLFCNQEEALGYTDTDNVDDAVEALKSVAKTFAITLGAEGAVCFDGEQLVRVSAPKVTAVDTNGAGDMFAGALMSGLSKGWSWEKSASFAALAASQVVTQYGPRLLPEQHWALLKEFEETAS